MWFQPTPTPSRKRSPERRASSAACLATRAVWRWGRTSTPGHELDGGRDAREVAEQHEYLVERVLLVVAARERPGAVRVLTAEHMVVRQDVREAELLGRCRKLADRLGMRSGFGLGKITPSRTSTTLPP